MKRVFLIAAVLVVVLAAVTGCGSEQKETLNVLNYDIYIDKDLLKEFQEANNVIVKYDTYATPEEMYIKAKAGASLFPANI